MTRSTVLRVKYVRLPILLALLLSSYALASQDFVGTWTQEADTLTYVNHKQSIKVTFPNDKWRVCTRPQMNCPLPWERPASDSSIYDILHAVVPEVLVTMVLTIEPIEPRDMTLVRYLALSITHLEHGASTGKSPIPESKAEIIHRESQELGLITASDPASKHLIAVFKEKGRFVVLSFACVTGLFESMKDQFWSIVDSYKHLKLQ